jgi:hypothetical protein
MQVASKNESTRQQEVHILPCKIASSLAAPVSTYFIEQEHDGQSQSKSDLHTVKNFLDDFCVVRSQISLLSWKKTAWNSFSPS